MKHRIVVSVVGILWTSLAFAQGDGVMTAPESGAVISDSALIAESLPPSLVMRSADEAPAAVPDTTVADTVPHPAQRRLLPENMSFMERWLWSENGVVRGVGIASPLTPDVRKHELAVRRTMLTMHQVGGFVTLGLMGATLFYGQRYLDHLQRNDRDMHTTFATVTILSYAATAALAALSPPPLIRREGEFSTTTLHKTLAWVHVAGMIITPILASAINRRSPSFEKQAHVHQIAAYATTAVFAASLVVITF